VFSVDVRWRESSGIVSCRLWVAGCGRGGVRTAVVKRFAQGPANRRIARYAWYDPLTRPLNPTRWDGMARPLLVSKSLFAGGGAFRGAQQPGCFVLILDPASLVRPEAFWL
jgi:hypothetical protein